MAARKDDGPLAGQISFFDGLAEKQPGDFVETPGRLLTWNELQIGMPVLRDCSTESMDVYRYEIVDRIDDDGPCGETVVLQSNGKNKSYVRRRDMDLGRSKLYQEG